MHDDKVTRLVYTAYRSYAPKGLLRGLDSHETMEIGNEADSTKESDTVEQQEPAWWQSWREGWAEYTEALSAATERAEAAEAERQRYLKLAAAENAPLIPLDEIDPKWMSRMMFVMHRRPDAVATR